MKGPARRRSDFEDLTEAEEHLLAECGTGELVWIGDGERPNAHAGPDHQIRADLIRYLLLGGCAELAAKVHEKGVRVAGAVITGPLDLEGCESKLDLVLVACHFNDTVTLRSARLGSVIFDHSHLPGIIADRLVTTGGVSLRGATVTGTVRLPGARVGGDLECDGATLSGPPDAKGPDAAAINADRLVTTGSVFLRGATVTGAVRLLGARIGGDLSCNGATLSGPPDAEGPDAAVLIADGLVTTGGVFLRGATVTGAVLLLGARIGGNLECDGATLTAREAGQTGQGYAMNLGGARIDGTFFVRGGTQIVGTLDMSAARFGSLTDDPDCWPEQGHLILNRCTYGAFTGQGVSAKDRITWLSRQDPSRYGQDFWPQPWEHCATVLREMGHRSDARLVLIDKEQRQRGWVRSKLEARLKGARLRVAVADAETSDQAVKLINSAAELGRNWPKAQAGEPAFREQFKKLPHLRKPLPDTHKLPDLITYPPADHAAAARDTVISTWTELHARRLWDATLSVFLGYGYRPSRAIIWLAVAWLLGAFFFAVAYGQGAMKPNNPFVLRSAEWAYCAPDYTPIEALAGQPIFQPRPESAQGQLACFWQQPEAQGYPKFNPLTYSLDTLLPIVSLEMQEYWIPNESAQHWTGQATRLFLWVQIAFGWALSLLAVAGFSGLVRND